MQKYHYRLNRSNESLRKTILMRADPMLVNEYPSIIKNQIKVNKKFKFTKF
jgi:hypothetical protein